ncbi:EpsG family protein [Providencia huaxiensis]|uniref:EpsG family protein n=1 Tax=Providencia huaxiensis TaxID=2027290 RepID=UPI002FE1C2A6
MWWVVANSTILFFSIISLAFLENKKGMAVGVLLGVFLLSTAFIFSINYNRDIMSDSILYSQYYKVIGDVSVGSLFQYKDDYEILFRLYTWSIAKITDDVHFYFGFTALIIYLISSFGLIALLGKTYGLIASFMLLTYPWFSLYSSSGIRQGFALSILFFSFAKTIDGKWCKAIFFVILASLFHRTAIVWLPIIAVMMAKPSLRKIMILYFIVSIFSFFNVFEIFLSKLIDIDSLSAREQLYFNNEENSYRVGFRWDFYLLSLFPLLSLFFLRMKFSFDGISEKCNSAMCVFYILNMYMLFFSFIRYYDRFAAFSWILIPAILCILVKMSGRLTIRSYVVMLFVMLANTVAFRFYNWGWFFEI